MSARLSRIRETLVSRRDFSDASKTRRREGGSEVNGANEEGRGRRVEAKEEWRDSLGVRGGRGRKGGGGGGEQRQQQRGTNSHLSGKLDWRKEEREEEEVGGREEEGGGSDQEVFSPLPSLKKEVWKE